MDSHVDLPVNVKKVPVNVNKVPVADSRDNLKTRLKERNLGPSKDGFTVVTTITQADNVANTGSYQVRYRWMGFKSTIPGRF